MLATAADVSDCWAALASKTAPMVKAKLAPKAWALRSRLPRFIGLLMPSTPMPK
jgi:hypothetical protein